MRINSPEPRPSFCSDRQVGVFAKRHGLTRKDAMAALIGSSVWPERFRRNHSILPADSQIRLLDLPIVIAGCGGLGGAVAEMLVRLGAGNMRIYDHDIFEESNLNRQRFCNESSLGRPKAEVVAQELAQIAPYGDFKARICRLAPQNLPNELAGAEIVIDCLDSVSGKKMLEQATREAGIAWLHGSVLGEEGFVCLAQPPCGLLEKLYGGDHGVSGAGSVIANVVAGTAALMCSLFTSWLVGKKKQTALIHADFAVPEIEAYQI